MLSQYKRCLKDDNPFAIPIFDTMDITKWYVMICNIPQNPWKKGEYYCSFEAPNDFPSSPPKNLEYYTPNGLFEGGSHSRERGPVCVSIGEFHPEKWRKVIGMHGFILNGIVNAFICYPAVENSGGIRVIRQTNDVRELLAIRSKKYNKDHNPNIYQIFEDFIKSHPELTAVKRLKKVREGIDPATLTIDVPRDNIIENSTNTKNCSTIQPSLSAHANQLPECTPLQTVEEKKQDPGEEEEKKQDPKEEEEKKQDPREEEEKKQEMPINLISETKPSTENCNNNSDEIKIDFDGLSEYVDDLLDNL